MAAQLQKAIVFACEIGVVFIHLIPDYVVAMDEDLPGFH
jgi:hypothetical protein